MIPSRSDAERPAHESKSGRVIEGDTSAKSTAKPEKRSILLFWKLPQNGAKPNTTNYTKPPKRCKKGQECGVCPPGSAGKGGCPPPPPVYTASCDPGHPEIGNNCGGRCLAGEHWNGVSCAARSDDCEIYFESARLLASEVRDLRGRMQLACAMNSAGQDCLELTQNLEAALVRYRLLLIEAPISCRAGLPPTP